VIDIGAQPSHKVVMGAEKKGEKLPKGEAPDSEWEKVEAVFSAYGVRNHGKTLIRRKGKRDRK